MVAGPTDSWLRANAPAGPLVAVAAASLALAGAGDLGDARDQFRLHVDVRSRRIIVDHDRQADRVRNLLVVSEEFVVGRHAVEGRDDHHAIGAHRLGFAAGADHLVGPFRAGADQHRHAAGRLLDHDLDDVGREPMDPVHAGAEPVVERRKHVLR